MPIPICIVAYQFFYPLGGLRGPHVLYIFAFGLMWAQDRSHQVESIGTQRSNPHMNRSIGSLESLQVDNNTRIANKLMNKLRYD